MHISYDECFRKILLILLFNQIACLREVNHLIIMDTLQIRIVILACHYVCFTFVIACFSEVMVFCLYHMLGRIVTDECRLIIIEILMASL